MSGLLSYCLSLLSQHAHCSLCRVLNLVRLAVITTVTVGALPLVISSAGSANAAETLRFGEAVQHALLDAPELAASDAGIEAARQNVGPAGELPDPRLVGSASNFPVTGPEQFSLTDDFMTMYGVGVMQEFPNRIKRQARTAEAAANVVLEQTRRQLTEVDLKIAVAQSWISRYNLILQLRAIDELMVENRSLMQTVDARVTAGRAPLADRVRPRQAALDLEERRDLLLASEEQEIALLRRWLGPRAALPLGGEAPLWQIDREQLLADLESHPRLAIYEPQIAVLDARVKQAEAEKRPDWSVEAMYSRRQQFGDMISLRFSMDLPIFTARRQDPRIAASHAQRNQLDAQQEQGLRQMRANLEGHLAEYQRLQRSVERQRTQTVPLSEEAAALAQTGWRNDTVPLNTLIEARIAAMEARLRLYELESERDQMAAFLHYNHDPDAHFHSSATALNVPLSATAAGSATTPESALVDTAPASVRVPAPSAMGATQ